MISAWIYSLLSSLSASFAHVDYVLWLCLSSTPCSASFPVARVHQFFVHTGVCLLNHYNYWRKHCSRAPFQFFIGIVRFDIRRFNQAELRFCLCLQILHWTTCNALILRKYWDRLIKSDKHVSVSRVFRFNLSEVYRWCVCVHILRCAIWFMLDFHVHSLHWYEIWKAEKRQPQQ